MFNCNLCCTGRFSTSIIGSQLRQEFFSDALSMRKGSFTGLILTIVAALVLVVSSASGAFAQFIVKEHAEGVVQRIDHDLTPCVAGSCRIKFAFVTPSRLSANLSRVSLKLSNKTFRATTLIKSSCQRASGYARPYIVGKKALIVDPSCLSVSSKKLNRKNTGQLDLTKFLASLNQLRASLIASGIPEASADQLVQVISGLVNGALVPATATPGSNVVPSTTPLSTVPVPAVPIPVVVTPVVVTTPIASSIVPTGPQCTGTVVDNTNYPCRDGKIYSVIYYPQTCSSNPPLCPTDYSLLNRVCFSNGQCQLNCGKSCAACGAAQIRDDTTTYACNGGVQYTVRYHPFTCQASCPDGFTADYQGCKPNGECQVNCRKSCGAPPPTQCSDVKEDKKTFPCKDGTMKTIFTYPASCSAAARPSCQAGYTEQERSCDATTCKLTCQAACSACTTAQFKDDTTSYQCKAGTEYTIRYHPNTCATSCPAGFTSDYAGCKDSGECQINCKRSCTAPPTPVVPTVTVVNRCDAQYVLVNGACKFGMRDNKCIAASLSNLNAPDPSTICINQSGTIVPFRGCEDGPNLGRNCATGQARDQRCSETDFRDHPYITSFNTPREVQPGFFGVYCCSQPTLGGVNPPAPGVSCRLVSAEDKYDHSNKVDDPNKLQPNQRVDCTSGGEAPAMKNCGVTPNNPYGNGTCGFKVVFGATKAMSAPVINDGRCCSGRANYVSHIIGGNGPEGRKGEHANYMCCGADGESACNG